MENQNNDRLSDRASWAGEYELAVPETKSLSCEGAEFTWEQGIRVLRKNGRLTFTIAGALTGLIVLATLLMRDVYQPVARLEIAPPTSGIKTLHEIESSTESENQDYLETQAQILKSDALAVSVIRELRLDRFPEFTGKPGTRAPEKASTIAERSSMPLSIDNPYMQEQLKLATLTPAEAAALEQFRQGLSVTAIRNTRLIEISYTSHDPMLARQITNTAVAKFIDNSYKHRYTTTMQASEWLATQLGELREKVQSANQAVSDYQRKYGLVELDDRDVPMTQLMGEVNHQLSEAQANRIESEAYVRMIELGQGEFVPAIRDDQVYQNLVMRYADVRAQLAQAKAVYGDLNTNVKKLEDQSVEIAKQIDKEKQRISDRIRTSYEAGKEREKLMMRSREKLRGQMGNVSSQLVGYHSLKNEAVANAELYNTLQARLKEAGIYAGLRSGNIRIVDLAANLQKATGPHRLLLISSGALMSCFLAILACFVKESFNNTVRTPEDVRLWIGLRSLALLPVMGLNKESDELRDGMNGQQNNCTTGSVTVMKPLSVEAESMRDLRTALFSTRLVSSPKSILISSSIQGEGKTTVAVNFAIAMAQLGRTCLVDADLRDPAVAMAFGIAGKTGLSDVLRGSVQLSHALLPISGIANLAVLPSGTISGSPADMLASSRMQAVCNALRGEFDFVVIDSPPIIRFSDARFLSSLVDEVVLVGRYGITTRRAMQRSAELLQEARAPVAGMVLNGIDLSSPDYHYFNYGYSKESGRRSERYAVKQPPLSPAESDDPPRSRGAHA